MEMVCDLCELGTEFMYTYTDKFNEFYPLKGYEINCVINIHTHPLTSSPAPTTNINSGISPSLYEDTETNTGSWPFIFFVLFYVLFVLCRSVYCLCVNVHCTTAIG
jgi:hypothetical protein